MVSHVDVMIQTEPGTNEQAAGPSQTESEVSLLDIVILVVGHKRFLARFVVGVLGTVLASMLPVRSEAKIVLLPSQQSSSIASALQRCWAKSASWGASDRLRP